MSAGLRRRLRAARFPNCECSSRARIQPREPIAKRGSGDAFLAVTAPLVAAGGALDLVGFIGNVVGALKVEIVGHRKPVEKAALIKGITALLK